MNKSIAYTHLMELYHNHRNNPGLPVLTNSIAIDLLELDKFITHAKSNLECDAIKIYFVRYPLQQDEGHLITADNNMSQISLAVIPAKFIDYNEWIAKDLKDQDGTNIFTLLVCEPGEPRDKSDKNTICPPKGTCP